MSAILQDAVRLQRGYQETQLTRLLRTDNSTLFIISFADGRPQCLLKVCKRPNAAKLQFQSLCDLHQDMGGGPLSVPEPGFLIEELSAYSMEWLYSLSVREHLCRLRTSNEECLRLVTKCGQWLRQFHLLGSDGEPRLPSLKGKIEYLSGIVDARPQSSNINRAVMIWLQDRRPDAESEKLAWGKLHGDFKADNLLGTQDRMVGIDIEVCRSGTQIMDVVQFLSNLELLMSRNWPVYWHNRTHQLDDAFLQGYNPELTLTNSVSFRWLQLFHLLHLKQQTGKSVYPLALWSRHALSKRMSQLLQAE